MIIFDFFTNVDFLPGKLSFIYFVSKKFKVNIKCDDWDQFKNNDAILQITFGITRAEYAERRHRLMERLGQREGKHHVVILPATPRRYMIDKIPYLYRQVSVHHTC